MAAAMREPPYQIQLLNRRAIVLKPGHTQFAKPFVTNQLQARATVELTVCSKTSIP
jgi:hypothetical protein